jgi:hypothetical protein
MFDPETLVVKGGILVLATLTVVRFVLFEYQSLVSDFRRKRRRAVTKRAG